MLWQLLHAQHLWSPVLGQLGQTNKSEWLRNNRKVIGTWAPPQARICEANRKNSYRVQLFTLTPEGCEVHNRDMLLFNFSHWSGDEMRGGLHMINSNTAGCGRTWSNLVEPGQTDRQAAFHRKT